jgi:hypothetical protein
MSGWMSSSAAVLRLESSIVFAASELVIWRMVYRNGWPPETVGVGLAGPGGVDVLVVVVVGGVVELGGVVEPGGVV